MESFLLAEGSFGAIDRLSNNWGELTANQREVLRFRAFNWLRVSLGNSFVYVCGEFAVGAARKLWKHVRSMYVKTDMATKLRLEQRFQNIYWDSSRHHVDSFLQELYLLKMEHSTAGFPLTDEAVFTKLLLCLPKEFDIERSEMKRWETPNLAEARKLLIEREEILVDRRDISSSRPLESGSIFTAEGRPGRGSSGVDLGVRHSTFAYKCYYCGKQGHRKKDCRKRMRDRQEGNLSNSSGSRGPHSGQRTQDSGLRNQTTNSGPPFSAQNRDHRSRNGNVSLINCDANSSTSTTEANGPPEYLPEDGFVFMMRAGTHTTVWIIDTGATHHICCMFSLLANPNPKMVRLSTGRKGSEIESTHAGVVRFDPTSKDFPNMVLTNVLFAPTAAANIISIAPFIQQGCHVVIRDKGLFVMKQNLVLMEGRADDRGLYVLMSHQGRNTQSEEVEPVSHNVCLTIKDMPKPEALRLLHVRLGHLNIGAIKRMIAEKMVDGIPHDLNFGGVELNCPMCIAGKSTRLAYRKPKEDQSNKPEVVVNVGDEVVSDSFGPIATTSRNGNRFVVEFVDVGSRFAFMFPIPSLDVICEKYVAFKNILSTQLGLKVKVFHTDGHGSYTSNAMVQTLHLDGTLQKIRSPHCPEQNAIAERRIRTVVEMARTLLLHSCVPTICWEDAVCHANYIRNRVATRSIMGKTPFEVFWRKKPNLEWVKPFGCLCYVLVHEGLRDGKFAAKSLPGVVLGVSDQHSGYKVLLLENRKVKVARDVRFYEDIFPFRRSAVGELQWMNPIDVPSVGYAEAGTFRDPFLTGHAESSKTIRDSELASLYRPIEVVKDTSVSDKSSSSDNYVAEGVKNEGKSLMMEAVLDGAILTINEITIDEALKGNDAQKWKDAFRTEFEAIGRTKTFQPMTEFNHQALQQERLRVHKTRPVLTIKRDENGNVARYKVRLVVQGYTMQKGVEFDQTFSPCARLNTIRLVIATAATYNWTVYHSDVPNAYLNGPCSKLILIQLPKMWNELMGNDLGRDGEPVVMANSLYGSPDAGRNWNKTFVSAFTQEGYRQCDKEPCLFVKGDFPLVTIVAIWVDDCFVTGSDNGEIKRLHDALISRFNLKVLGPLTFALGIAVKTTQDGVHLSQTAFIEKVAARFGQTDAKPLSLPAQKGFRPLKSQGPQTAAEKEDMARVPYRSAIGSLLYIAMGTRPDIMFVVSLLARFSQNPGRTHWAGVKSVIRYLMYTKGKGLFYNALPKGEVIVPSGYSDSSFNDTEDGRSTLGYVIRLGNNVISWKSKVSATVPQSAFEAEWVALNMASREMTWTRDVVTFITGQNLPPSTVLVDNSACIDRLDERVTDGNKHFRPKYFLVTHLVQEGAISVNKVASERNVADILTKALGNPLFGDHVRSLCVQ